MKNLSICFVAALSLASFGCKKKGGMAEAKAKMNEFADKMCACKDTKCAQGVSDDMTKWSTEMSKTASKDEKPSDADMKDMEATTKKLTDCMQKAMGAGDMGGTPAAGSDTMAGSGAAPAAGSDTMAGSAAAGSAAPAAAAGDLPAECADYKAAIEKLASCDKLPQATRDALKQSYEQTSAAWANVPAEGKASLATSCKSAADAVKQSAAACQ